LWGEKSKGILPAFWAQQKFKDWGKPQKRAFLNRFPFRGLAQSISLPHPKIGGKSQPPCKKGLKPPLNPKNVHPNGH